MLNKEKAERDERAHKREDRKLALEELILKQEFEL